MPRGTYDRSKMKGKRGRRPVPVIFDKDVKVGNSTHRVKISVDPRCYALDLSGSASTSYAQDAKGLMKQVGDRIGREALHNMSLTQFAAASADLENICKEIGTAIDDKIDIIVVEKARAKVPTD